MAARKTTRKRSVSSRRSRPTVKQAFSLLLGRTRLRGDPLGEFTWVTAGRAYVQGSSGNNQPQFGLWYSPTKPLRDRSRIAQRS